MSEPSKAGRVARNVPTKPYVDKLFETLGVPKDGDDIRMADIEAAIGVNRHTSRWTTVVGKWKETLRVKHGVVITCKYGEGIYHAADDDEKVDEAMRRKGLAEREAGRVLQILDTVERDRLKDGNKTLYDNVRLNMQQGKLKLAQAVK